MLIAGLFYFLPVFLNLPGFDNLTGLIGSKFKAIIFGRNNQEKFSDTDKVKIIREI